MNRRIFAFATLFSAQLFAQRAPMGWREPPEEYCGSGKVWATHGGVVVAELGASMKGFDASTGESLWSRSLGVRSSGPACLNGSDLKCWEWREVSISQYEFQRTHLDPRSGRVLREEPALGARIHAIPHHGDPPESDPSWLIQLSVTGETKQIDWKDFEIRPPPNCFPAEGSSYRLITLGNDRAFRSDGPDLIRCRDGTESWKVRVSGSWGIDKGNVDSPLEIDNRVYFFRERCEPAPPGANYLCRPRRDLEAMLTTDGTPLARVQEEWGQWLFHGPNDDLYSVSEKFVRWYAPDLTLRGEVAVKNRHFCTPRWTDRWITIGDGATYKVVDRQQRHSPITIKSNADYLNLAQYEDDLFLIGYKTFARISAATGRVIWQRRHRIAPASRPVIIDGRVIFRTRHDGLVALDARTGKVLWEVRAEYRD